MGNLFSTLSKWVLKINNNNIFLFFINAFQDAQAHFTKIKTKQKKESRAAAPHDAEAGRGHDGVYGGGAKGSGGGDNMEEIWQMRVDFKMDAWI